MYHDDIATKLDNIACLMTRPSFWEVEGMLAELQVESAAEPMTSVQDSASTTVRVKSLDITNETSGQLPTMLFKTKS